MHIYIYTKQYRDTTEGKHIKTGKTIYQLAAAQSVSILINME